MQKAIIPLVESVNGVQQSGKVVIHTASPYKGIAVGVSLDLRAINKKFPERDEPFFFQTPQKLVMQLLQYLTCQLFILKIIKSIPVTLEHVTEKRWLSLAIFFLFVIE